MNIKGISAHVSCPKIDKFSTRDMSYFLKTASMYSDKYFEYDKYKK